MTANKKTLLQRMHEAMANVTYVQKEKKSGMQYSITSHDDVTAKVRPALHNAGVIYYPTALVSEQVGNRTQESNTVKPKPKTIEAPSWHEWAKKTHEEIASVRNEQERNELRTRITPAYQTCQKEAPELAKSIRESLTERKAHFAK